MDRLGFHDSLDDRGGVSAETGKREQRPPNFILILCDNLGYGDLGCYGSRKHRPPHVDRLASEGIRFTSFYSASGVCTPSRASLMTGCYPRRVNLHQDEKGNSVLKPVAKKGLHPEEVTLAEILKTRGYATMCIGKWHLGDQPPFLPTRQGFDAYFGIPYSDDMTPRKGFDWPPLPLLEGEEVVEAPVVRETLTRRFTQRAMDFIEANKDKPFFLYLAHATPGSTPHPFAGDRFRGKSANGPYGDSVEEIDWSTGEILAALKKFEIDEQTMMVWTSDNGAPKRNPPQGSNRPLSGWGYTTAEGGMRVPCIMRQPGRIPHGRVCDELCTMMDLLPTLSRLAGAEAPRDRKIDGKDIRPLMFGEKDAASPYEAFYYYQSARLDAVRSGRWKLFLPRQGNPFSLRLYDLESDPGETTNVAGDHPEVVHRLLALAEEARRDLGDGEVEGLNQRPAGWVPNPKPLVLAENQP